MNIPILPARKVAGTVSFPGDKSISHRLALLAGIARGITTIENFASSADCHSTLSCLKSLGVGIKMGSNQQVSIQGAGLHGLKPSEAMLDAGNSGSTIRMLSGILAGQPFLTRIAGDASLCRRPMKRIMIPLQKMGAQVEGRDGNFPPLAIRGNELSPIQYHLPVASAQVKSSILLAGLYAKGKTIVMEPVPTRNHTELALAGFGVPLDISGNQISIQGGIQPQAINATAVPGDISSAAFFAVAACLLPGSEIILNQVGLNPGRRGILDLLMSMGASIQLLEENRQGGEEVGVVRIRSASLQGGKVSGDLIPGVIDEIPILAVLGTQTENGLEIRDASELRVKESDRIRSVVDNLRAMQAQVEEFEDGFIVAGGQKLRGARIRTCGDHRIAMAFSIAGLIAEGVTEIEDAGCAAVSFPDFYQTLESVSVR
jgi:3-phosphoshikimate 1-carboxyvinyltransferase